MNNLLSTVINVNNIYKKYEDVQALNGISFDVKKSEIFGLIGPDGSGKSTLFKILSGIINADSGLIDIKNYQPQFIRQKIGFLTQQFSFYPDLTVNENIKYSAGVRRIDKKILSERKARYLEFMGLEKFGNRLAAQLSGGMKQKLALCCILIFEPDILILDEPTCGVDPISRREFWDILSVLSMHGHTILIATPYLDEAERCNRVALMYQGMIKQIDTPQNLKESTGLHCYEVRSTRLLDAESILSNRQNKDISNIIDIQTFGDKLDILVNDKYKGKKEINDLLNLSLLNNFDLLESKLSLENVYVSGLKKIVKEPEYIPFMNNQKNNLKINEVAIGAYNLIKKFDSFDAVKNISLEIKYGEIFGLLGANGAGKTTTIKMLCGLIKQTDGKIFLANESSNIRTPDIRNKIGYMSQKFTLYNDLTIYENLKFYCGVYNVDPKYHNDKISWVLNMSGLVGKENMITGNLPGGWKQRVAFCASVMHEPEILFLDEPTSGVDPLARRQFWRLIEELARSGTAILVSTHYLEEAEHCNRMAFMSGGAIIAEGSPNDIKNSQQGILYEIDVDQPQKATLLIKQILNDWQASMFGDKIHVVLEGNQPDFDDINNLLIRNGIILNNFYKYPFSLEDAFIQIIEKSRKENSE